MTEQETLDGVVIDSPFNPRDHHIWAKYLAEGGHYLNTLAWNRARADRSYVGECRVCGGYLMPEPSGAYPPGPDVATVDYGARCTSCGHEFVAPDGKVLQGSARHSQMRRSYLKTRSGVIAVPRSDGG